METESISPINRNLSRVIGSKIRAIRSRKGLTQEELGELLDGMSQQAVSEIESGELSIGLDRLSKVANALNTDLRIAFEPTDLDEFDDDDMLDIQVSLPVKLIKELNREAEERMKGFAEHMEDLLNSNLIFASFKNRHSSTQPSSTEESSTASDDDEEFNELDDFDSDRSEDITEYTIDVTA